MPNLNTKYELTCQVELKNLFDVLPKVTQAIFKEIEEPKVHVNHTSKGHKTKARRQGLMTGEEIITKLVSDGRVHTTAEIVKLFKEQGFGDNSASPRISNMVKRGELTMLGDGKYQIAKRK